MHFSQSISATKVSVKQSNRKSILDFMRESGEVSVAEISERVRISKPTVKKVVDYYIEKNMVLETGKGSSSEEGGKKPNLFTFNNEFGYIIALHIGYRPAPICLILQQSPAIITLTGKDVPMPYAANLEKLALPNANDVVEAVKSVLYL